MDLESIDYISRNPNREDSRKLPPSIFLNSLRYYHAIVLQKDFSREKFIELIPTALPSYTHGSVWHHVPFGGIDPNYGKYAVILKDKFIEVMSEQDKGGEHLIDLLTNLAKRSKS